MNLVPDTKVFVRRTWIRDGVTNVISLRHAVANIAHTKIAKSKDARKALLEGRRILTKHAAYEIVNWRPEFIIPEQAERQALDRV